MKQNTIFRVLSYMLLKEPVELPGSFLNKTYGFGKLEKEGYLSIIKNGDSFYGTVSEKGLRFLESRIQLAEP
jgi:hypothetical protein